MKQLVLIRHAKSCWKNNFNDKERPLKKRGKKDAKLVSKYLQKHLKINPNLIITSSAKRATQTAKVFIKYNLWTNVKIQQSPDVYDFSGESAFNVITSCPNHINTLVLFGHNPTFTLLASQLGSEFIDNIPTSGVVVISFDIEKWESIENGKTIKTLFPRDLK